MSKHNYADYGYDPMQPRQFCIRQVHHETKDTFTLACESVENGPEFSFAPGQFNMVYIYGVGEIPISISGNPDNPRQLIHTTRAVGMVTKAMRRLNVGEQLGIRGPYGTTWPVEIAQGYDVVFIAGGIGLAPLRPALYQVLAHRADYGKVILLYGTRNPSDILYRAELEAWRGRFDLDIYVTVDYADDSWHGNVGVVTNLIARAPFDPHHTIAMICGPEAMMRYSAMGLEKRGLSTDSIYISMERNMKCAIGLCGHCQYGRYFICKDGPVFRYQELEKSLATWEL
jgi:NAD(P)H-flavin reductase